MYAEELNAFLEELMKRVTPTNNLFHIIFSQINLYTIALEKSLVSEEIFKKLTDKIKSIIYNFNEEAIILFASEINCLFIETLRVVRISHLESLVEATNAYFFPSMIKYAEKYVFDLILRKEDDPLYQELKMKKSQLEDKAYLKELYLAAYSLHLFSHQSLMHPNSK